MRVKPAPRNIPEVPLKSCEGSVKAWPAAPEALGTFCPPTPPVSGGCWSCARAGPARRRMAAASRKGMSAPCRTGSAKRYRTPLNRARKQLDRPRGCACALHLQAAEHQRLEELRETRRRRRIRPARRAELGQLQCKQPRQQGEPAPHVRFRRREHVASGQAAQPPPAGVARTAQRKVGADELMQGKLRNCESRGYTGLAKLAEIDRPLHVLALRARS